MRFADDGGCSHPSKNNHKGYPRACRWPFKFNIGGECTHRICMGKRFAWEKDQRIPIRMAEPLEHLPLKDEVLEAKACKICMDQPRQVRLQCGHKFCQHCTIYYIQDRDLRCPLCRTQIFCSKESSGSDEFSAQGFEPCNRCFHCERPAVQRTKCCGSFLCDACDTCPICRNRTPDVEEVVHSSLGTGVSMHIARSFVSTQTHWVRICYYCRMWTTRRAWCWRKPSSRRARMSSR